MSIFIESQFEFEQLRKRLEKQLKWQVIEKENLEKQIKTLHSKTQFPNKKVIVFFIYFKRVSPKIRLHFYN
jgi:hypothetical protein